MTNNSGKSPIPLLICISLIIGWLVFVMVSILVGDAKIAFICACVVAVFLFWMISPDIEQQNISKQKPQKRENSIETEWKSLSEEEKGRRTINKRREEGRIEQERMDRENTYIKNVVNLIKQHPGEFLTKKRILDLLKPQTNEEKAFYKMNLFSYHDSQLENANIHHTKENDTTFYFYYKLK